MIRARKLVSPPIEMSIRANFLAFQDVIIQSTQIHSFLYNELINFILGRCKQFTYLSLFSNKIAIFKIYAFFLRR